MNTLDTIVEFEIKKRLKRFIGTTTSVDKLCYDLFLDEKSLQKYQTEKFLQEHHEEIITAIKDLSIDTPDILKIFIEIARYKFATNDYIFDKIDRFKITSLSIKKIMAGF